MNIKIPTKVNLILSTLNRNGYQAYCVGGCVRDSLLGLEPKDWDITTDATPDQVENMFKSGYRVGDINLIGEEWDIKVIPTGKEYGTITVILDHEPFEITTFRKDGKYEDGRRPDNVKFGVSLKEDLARRDFTINSLAYNDKVGLVDYFNGFEDLNNKIIKCVGNPNERFNEDALRMLRAVRFASRLNFNIEKATSKAITDNIKLLENVSKERINAELSQILKNAPGMKSNLTENLFDILGYLFNYTKEALLQKLDCMIQFNAKFNSSNFIEILKLIFDNNTCLVHSWLKKYKFSNNAITYILEVINTGIYFNSLNKYEEEITDYEIKVALNKFSEFYILEAFSGSWYMKARIIELAQDPYRLEDLEINGDDLINIGITGTKIGRVLETLMEAVLENPRCNTKETLIKIAKSYWE